MYRLAFPFFQPYSVVALSYLLNRPNSNSNQSCTARWISNFQIDGKGFQGRRTPFLANPFTLPEPGTTTFLYSRILRSRGNRSLTRDKISKISWLIYFIGYLFYDMFKPLTSPRGPPRVGGYHSLLISGLPRSFDPSARLMGRFAMHCGAWTLDHQCFSHWCLP